MSEPASSSSPLADDPRLFRIVQGYLADLEAGRRPDRDALYARHPDLADELAACLDGLEFVRGAAPALHPVAEQSADGVLTPESPLGDFRIVREVGRGGMGVVYEAVQLSLGRRVALKVLPFAAVLDPRHLQRFRHEAQAAAHLHHPHIVPVHGVGCERGVHYYAMQFIDGHTVADVVRQMRQHVVGRPGASEAPTGLMALSTERSQRPDAFFRTVARLGVQAAEALEHAHRQGVVHRDVKPANLLVDARGDLWITDFGLAQFHADAGLTLTGDMVGTLRYMSPEQTHGSRAVLDHRTDIYSLGVTLYELLTAEHAFGGNDRHDLLRRIVAEEPPSLRSLDRAIPVELETVVLKAMAKDLAERYATAQELADDLRRFLDDKPVLARRPTLGQRAARWARRHKPIVAAAVVALLLSVAGLAVATALAAQAYDRERQQRTQAEESFRQVRHAVDQLVTISEEELAGDPRLEGLRRRLLDAALTYYQDFLDQRRDDPTIQKELKDGQDKVKVIIEELTTLMGSFQYALLQRLAVQDELNLSPDQRAALAEIDKKWHTFFHGPGRRGFADERKRLALAKEQETEVTRLLSPVQLQRFRQVALQVSGPRAFADPDVAAALRLTTEQKRKVREFQDEMGFLGRGFGPFRGGRRGGLPDRPGDGPRGGGRRGGGPPERFEDWRGAQAKLLAQLALTPEQKRKWEEMTGKPFEGEIHPPGPPRFPPQ